jgi:hypothetical protein
MPTDKEKLAGWMKAKEGNPKPTATKVQSIIFDKEKFKLADAKKWLSEHNKKAPVVDETENTLRFRQEDPDDFQEGSFRIIELVPGIKAVIGRPKA